MSSRLLLIFITLILSVSPFSSYAGADETGDKRPWLAVHDFTITPQVAELGVNGWQVAEKIENALAQKGVYRLLTRAKISQVLKEKNMSSGESMTASDFGEMIGANFIVTGQISNNGNTVILIGKLVDVSKEAGEIEKSFDFSYAGDSLKDSVDKLPGLYNELATYLTMSPGDFLNAGLAAMDENNFVKAKGLFQEARRLTPVDEIKTLLSSAKSSVQPVLPGNLSSPGELLDFGLGEMKKGNKDNAFAAFSNISKTVQMARLKIQVFELEKLYREAEEKAGLERAGMNRILEESSKMFTDAIAAQSTSGSSSALAEVCDKALSNLEKLSLDKHALSLEDKAKIEELIKKIKEYKKGLFAGPAKGREWTVPDLGLEMVYVKAGIFGMGDPASENGKEFSGDNPYHMVHISSPFWIGKHEVTIGEFLAFLHSAGRSGSFKNIDKTINWTSPYVPVTKSYEMKDGTGMTWGDLDQPMSCVSWQGAELFCQWLTAKEKEAGRLPKGFCYRLPTEAEWEYACRADSKSSFFSGDSAAGLSDYAWYEDNNNTRTSIAAGKKPNKWGLYDTAGNVWELCRDWYSGPYLQEEVTDPYGSSSSPDNTKVARGGSFMSSSADLKVTTRYPVNYKEGKKNVGFRVVCAKEI